jgi:hypothetical protein
MYDTEKILLGLDLKEKILTIKRIISFHGYACERTLLNYYYNQTISYSG